MYIRIKTKKNNKEKITKYAYLVENKRRWKKPKQKVKKYLGKVYEYPNTQSSSIDISNLSYQDSIKQILLSHLLEINFKLNEDLIQNEDLSVNLIDFKVKNSKNKNAVIKLNDGFISNYSLKQALKFNLPNATDKECAKALATILISSGFKLTDDTFISLFKKVYKFEV